MYINEEKKFIFFHIPKNAGTSIVMNFLEDHLQYAKHVCYYLLNNSLPCPSNTHAIKSANISTSLYHMTYAEVKGLLPTIDLNEYFKFCFVRNPYTRIYSAYGQYMEEFISTQSIAFNEFIKVLNHENIRSEFEYIHFKPSYLYAFYEGKLMMDFVGRFENINHDFQKVCDTIQWPFKIDHCGKRSKDHENYLDYYTADSIRKVNELYAKDFELFEYEMLDPKDFPDILPAAQKE